MTTITPPAPVVFNPAPPRPALDRLGIASPRTIASRPYIPLVLRFVLLVGGSSIIGVFVAILIWNGLGPGPMDVLVVGVSARTGLSLTLICWSMFGAMNLISWIMGRRPGFGTVAAPMIAGFVIALTVSGLENV
jgi:uncharacterized membrane protein YczE